MNSSLIYYLNAQPAIYFSFLLICGAVTGSFMGVVITRLPVMILHPERAGEFNLCQPASHCETCKQPLRIWENIPLVSWLLLKGRCSKCRVSIPVLVPVIEFFCALYFCFCGWLIHDVALLIATLIFGVMALTLAVIDFRNLLLPDYLTISLLWCGLLFHMWRDGVVSPEYILGVVGGFLFFSVIRLCYQLIFHQEGLGGGDCKYLAALGAWLGWHPLMLLCVIASCLTLLVTIILQRKYERKIHIPFGPALGISGFCLFIKFNFFTF